MTSRALWASAADSQSLWNFTLSPGWDKEQASALRLAVMKYGCGNWKEIMKHFPANTCGQLNLQTQRLFGQQSLAEFYKLHIDPRWIKEKNDKIENVQRKNGCIINTGDNMKPEQRNLKREQNKQLYGLKDEEWSKIVVPIMYGPEPECATIRDKMNKVMGLWECLYVMKEYLQVLEEHSGGNIKEYKKENKKERSKSIETQPLRTTTMTKVKNSNSHPQTNIETSPMYTTDKNNERDENKDCSNCPDKTQSQTQTQTQNQSIVNAKQTKKR